MGLKTLKDMDTIDLSDDIPELARDRFVSSIQLKQEAIKWVKVARKSMDENKSAGIGVVVFKNFFNITEEDLK